MTKVSQGREGGPHPMTSVLVNLDTDTQGGGRVTEAEIGVKERQGCW